METSRRGKGGQGNNRGRCREKRGNAYEPALTKLLLSMFSLKAIKGFCEIPRNIYFC